MTRDQGTRDDAEHSRWLDDQLKQPGMIDMRGMSAEPADAALRAQTGRAPPDGTFTVSRREFYRRAANWPEMRALAAWSDRVYAAQRENHDPGDEDRS